MLSCRNGPRLRLLALLGLVLVFAGGAGGAWAQAANSNTVNRTPDKALNFPFLSVDVAQEKLLANAFMFQMRLFTGATSQAATNNPNSVGGGFAAMRYLALIAVMIGSILVIFFKKYQRVAVIIPWFVLILVSVFVPLSSKLLFYPILADIPPALSQVGRTRSVVAEVNHDGTDCSIKPEGCGFTPQLAAIHLGTTLQMVVSDIFRSKQWTGLLERQAAATRLQQLADFNLSPSWLLAGRRVLENCRDADWASLMPGADPNAPDTPVTKGTMTLKDLVEDYQHIYYGLATRAGGLLPPMAVLPETKPQATSLGWNDTDVISYQNAMTILYNQLGSSKPEGYTKVTFDGAGKGEVTVTDALNGMPLLGHAKFVQNYQSMQHNLPLSMMFLRYSDVDNAEIDARKCYVQDKVGNDTWWEYFGVTTVPSVENCLMNASSGRIYQYYFDPSYHKQQFDEFYAALNGKDVNITAPAWKALAKNYEAIKDMPIGYGIPSRETSNQNYPAVKIKAENVKSRLTCNQLGRPLVRDALDALSNKPASGKQMGPFFENLVTLLESSNTNVPERLTWDNISAKPRDEIEEKFPNKAQVIDNLKVYLNESMRKAEENNASGKSLTPEMRREVFMRNLIGLMEDVTIATNNITDNDALVGAKEDATKIRIVGNETLSSYGGNIAAYVGEKLTGILAEFTGPLAVAYVYFLNILVDMTLLAMITLTPFLFLVGLVVPTSAAGVLMISIVSVMVLKFIPVTMIILNALGGMMFDMLPVSVGENADFARDLLIIAMSGMYMSAVGLTFFLMFKLGDPAAFLGRLVALDSASKQLAETGWNATKLIASAAVAIASGGVAGGVAGAWQAGRRYAPGSAGDAMDAAGKLAKGDGKDSKPPKPQEGPPEEERPLVGESDEAAQAAATEDIMEGATEEQDGDDAEGMPAALRSELGDRGMNLGFGEVEDVMGSDGKRYQLSKDANGALAATNEAGKTMALTGPLSGKLLTPDMGPALTAGQLSNLKEARNEAGQKLDHFAEHNVPPGETVPFTDKDGNVHQVTHHENGVKSVDGVNLANGQRIAATAGAAPRRAPPVTTRSEDAQAAKTVATVTTVAETPRIAEAPAHTTELSRMEAAQEARNRRDNGGLSGSGSGGGGGVPPVSSSPAPQPVPRQPGGGGAAQASDANEPQRYAQTLGDVDGIRRANLNSRVARQLDEIDIELSSPKITDARKAKLEGIRSKLENLDTVSLEQGEIGLAYGTLNELQRAMAQRGAADDGKHPLGRVGAIGSGASRGFLSGLYGSFTGAFGSGTGSIPFIGPAMREISNEWFQAPERANAIRMAGGFGKWMGAKGDAERLKFYNQEMVPLVSGHQYQEMLNVGGFQAQYDVARQAASEAVARTRSNYLAIDAAGGVMSAGKLSGLGSIDAAARLGAIHADSVLAQGKAVEMEVALVDKNNRLTGETTKVEVAMTPKLLNEIQGGIGVKRAAGSISTMLLDHYGIAEKQYIRGGDWDNTRGMANNADAARKFAMKDIDNDYTVEGRLKMMAGKEMFTDMKAQSKNIIQAMHHDNLQYTQKYNQIVASSGGLDNAYQGIALDPQKAVKYRDLIQRVTAAERSNDPIKINAEKQVVVEKLAKDSVSLADLKMQPIFVEAENRGAAKWQVKSVNAIFSQGNEQAQLLNTIENSVRSNLKAGGMAEAYFKSVRMNSKDGQPFYMDAIAPEFMNVMRQNMMKMKGTSNEDATRFAGEFMSILNNEFKGKPEINQILRIERDNDNQTIKYGVDKDLVNRVLSKIQTDPALSTRVSEGLKRNLDTIQKVWRDDGVFMEGDANEGTEHLIFNN